MSLALTPALAEPRFSAPNTVPVAPQGTVKGRILKRKAEAPAPLRHNDVTVASTRKTPAAALPRSPWKRVMD